MKNQKSIVLLIHGIRTRANWQGFVSDLIEKHTSVTPIPIKYGYFDVFRFWLPLNFLRRQPIERVHKEIREVRKKNPEADIQIIAHSYGTHTICTILERFDDIRLSRLVLCGSVVRSDYNWSRVSDQIAPSDEGPAIINECGTKDIWPVLARSTTWGYGSTGTFGFGTVSVKDRLHPLPHSGYFSKKFVKDNWLPLLETGTFRNTTSDRTGIGSPWWMAPLSLPYRWGLVTGLAAFVWWGMSFTPLGMIPNPIEIVDDTPSGNGSTQTNVNAQNGIAAGGDIKAGDITIGADNE
ncbi:MAG: hypothetical protein ABJH63_10255 [Rhizobiaceae bacterium]